jgi:hypothetical protein
MTARGMEPCSPAKRGTPRTRVCGALTGAPQEGKTPNPPSQMQGPGEVTSSTETRLLRLAGGKERPLLPIFTVSGNGSGRPSLPLPGWHPHDAGDLALVPCLIQCDPRTRTPTQGGSLLHHQRMGHDRCASPSIKTLVMPVYVA